MRRIIQSSEKKKKKKERKQKIFFQFFFAICIYENELGESTNLLTLF